MRRSGTLNLWYCYSKRRGRSAKKAHNAPARRIYTEPSKKTLNIVKKRRSRWATPFKEPRAGHTCRLVLYFLVLILLWFSAFVKKKPGSKWYFSCKTPLFYAGIVDTLKSSKKQLPKLRFTHQLKNRDSLSSRSSLFFCVFFQQYFRRLFCLWYPHNPRSGSAIDWYGPSPLLHALNKNGAGFRRPRLLYRG